MNYVEKHLQIAKRVYKQFILNEDTLKAVAISGSVARGYSDKHSDIDILIFDTSLEVYRKKYLKEENVNIEAHYVPLSMIDLLYSSIKDLIISDKKPNIDTSNTLILGEKRCLEIKDNPSSLRKVLANWRELKKLFDGLVILDNDSWYDAMKKKYPLTPNTAKINNILNDLAVNCEDPIENLLSMMRLYMVKNGGIFSKVLWLDKYLDDELLVIKENINDIFLPLPSEYDKWFVETEERLEILKEKHKEKICEQCHGDLNKCCVARYSEHFFKDAKRAMDNHYHVGMMLSLFRSNENIEKLSKINNTPISNLSQSYINYFNKTINNVKNQLTCIHEKLSENRK